MKRFALKDNRKILIELEKCNRYMHISALDDIDHHEIGYLVFKIQQGGKAFLCSIKVTDKDYLQTGVGSIMLHCFESYCKSKRIEYIEGRYYPDGDGAEYARDFYDKHGYSITRDGYEQYVFKPLYRYSTPIKYALSEDNVSDIDDGKDSM